MSAPTQALRSRRLGAGARSGAASTWPLGKACAGAASVLTTGCSRRTSVGKYVLEDALAPAGRSSSECAEACREERVYSTGQ